MELNSVHILYIQSLLSVWTVSQFDFSLDEEVIHYKLDTSNRSLCEYLSLCLMSILQPFYSALLCRYEQ